MTTNFRTLRLFGLTALATGLSGAVALGADVDDARVHAGRAGVYQQLDKASLEEVSTPERIMAVTRGTIAPSEIWRTLEHAERVECLSCIPAVAELVYASDERTREISAWWLRRRIFGVFGPGEVYSQIVGTLNDPTASVHRRASAASAIGEFLSAAGVPHVGRAALEDAAPEVRLASVNALRRMNTEGNEGELGRAMADDDEAVRVAAIDASIRVNVFSGVALLLTRISDPSSTVRVRAVEALGHMRVDDAVGGLVALLSVDQEENARVRQAAAASLGEIGNREARDAVSDAEANDPDSFVRAAARVALLRL